MIGRRWLYVGLILLTLGIIVWLTSCEDSSGARQDLPTENQKYDTTTADIIVMPDGFPNVAHKCMESTGFWTTTDRTLILIYNDWACPGSTREHDMTVINGVPRAVINASG